MGRFDDREQKLNDARVDSNLLFDDYEFKEAVSRLYREDATADILSKIDTLNFKVFNFNGASKRNPIALLIYRLSEECFMFNNLYLDEQIQVLDEISNMINFEIRNTDQIKSAIEYFTVKIIMRST